LDRVDVSLPVWYPSGINSARDWLEKTRRKAVTNGFTVFIISSMFVVVDDYRARVVPQYRIRNKS